MRLAARARHWRLFENRAVRNATIGLYGRYLDVRYGRSGVPTVLNGEPLRLARGAALPGHWDDEAGCARYEQVLWESLTGSLSAEDRFADVGANIGVYTIAAARRCTHVTAIEPDPKTSGLLLAHVRLNGLHNVDVVVAAAGDRADEVEFVASASPMASVGDGWQLDAPRCMVRMVPLDDVVTTVDVMKIDVEGYEGPVLLGAQALLSDPLRKPRSIFLEVHPPLLPATGWDVERLRAQLREFGYEVKPLEDVDRGILETWVATTAAR